MLTRCMYAYFRFGKWLTNWSYWLRPQILLVWFGRRPETRPDQTNKLTMWKALRAYDHVEIGTSAVQCSAAREVADKELRNKNITSVPTTEYDGLRSTPMSLQTVLAPTS